jgi:hypothetical protein
VGTFAAELLFVVRALEGLRIRGVAAMHVGDVTGAVVGTERVSLDVLGKAVGAAEAALDVALLEAAARCRQGGACELGGLVTITAAVFDALQGTADAPDIRAPADRRSAVLLPTLALDASSTWDDTVPTGSADAKDADDGGFFAPAEVPVEPLEASCGAAQTYALVWAR